jgi:hypothetical protein
LIYAGPNCQTVPRLNLSGFPSGNGFMCRHLSRFKHSIWSQIFQSLLNLLGVLMSCRSAQPSTETPIIAATTLLSSERPLRIDECIALISAADNLKRFFLYSSRKDITDFKRFRVFRPRNSFRYGRSTRTASRESRSRSMSEVGRMSGPGITCRSR